MLAFGLGLESARAEQLFVRVTTAQGVVGAWYNPVAELDETSLVQYGEIDSLKWSVTSARDAASGLPTGRRQHRPVDMRVRMSSGVLDNLGALTANAPVSVEILWFARGDDGSYKRQRVMTLTQATVSNVAIQTVREDGQMRTFADLSFVYNTVGITDHVTQMSYSDSWGTGF
jgi:type VI protein secretion system component Hcp